MTNQQLNFCEDFVVANFRVFLFLKNDPLFIMVEILHGDKRRLRIKKPAPE